MRPVKIGLLVLGALVLLAVLGAGAWYGAEVALCDNRIAKEEKAPGGKLRAVLFSRSCAFDRSPNFQLSVLEEGSALHDFDTGNIFIAEKEFNFRWDGERKLVVDGGGTFTLKETFYGFDIRPE